MSNLFKINSIQNGGRKVAPTFNLALWEYTYELELKRYRPLVEKKAERLKRLRGIDLFSLSDQESKKRFYEIKYLESELSDMVGIMKFTENLKEAYLDTSVWLANYFEKKERGYIYKINELNKNYQIIYAAFHNSSQYECIWIQLILNCLEEAKSKGIVLECLKNIELWK